MKGNCIEEGEKGPPQKPQIVVYVLFFNKLLHNKTRTIFLHGRKTLISVVLSLCVAERFGWGAKKGTQILVFLQLLPFGNSKMASEERKGGAVVQRCAKMVCRLTSFFRDNDDDVDEEDGNLFLLLSPSRIFGGCWTYHLWMEEEADASHPFFRITRQLQNLEQHMRHKFLSPLAALTWFAKLIGGKDAYFCIDVRHDTTSKQWLPRYFPPGTKLNFLTFFLPLV